jgi:hypothetical protein
MKSKPRSAKKGRWIIGAVSCCLIIGLVPIRYLASPGWDVLVVTADQKPLAGVFVRLSYTNFSVEGPSAGHEITLTTGADGKVVFPQQRGWACLLQRIFWTGISATGGVHASYGRHAFVFVFGDDYDGTATSGAYVTDWAGTPALMHSTIVALKKTK